jgi:hypothetical protein
MILVGHKYNMQREKNTHKILVGKSELKRMLVSLRHRWENNVASTDSTGLELISMACFCEHKISA